MNRARPFLLWGAACAAFGVASPAQPQVLSGPNPVTRLLDADQFGTAQADYYIFCGDDCAPRSVKHLASVSLAPLSHVRPLAAPVAAPVAQLSPAVAAPTVAIAPAASPVEATTSALAPNSRAPKKARKSIPKALPRKEGACKP